MDILEKIENKLDADEMSAELQDTDELNDDTLNEFPGYDEEYEDDMDIIIYDSIIEFILGLNKKSLSDKQKDEYDHIMKLIEVHEPFNEEPTEHTDMDQEDEDEDDYTEDAELTSEGMINELMRKRVVRGGKVIKRVFCNKGYKALTGKCVRMSGAEKRKRMFAARRSVKKRRSKMASALRKRRISMRRRGSSGIK